VQVWGGGATGLTQHGDGVSSTRGQQGSGGLNAPVGGDGKVVATIVSEAPARSP